MVNTPLGVRIIIMAKCKGKGKGTIGCYLANVRPIGNVCYDRQKRSHTAIGISCWW